MTTKTLENLWKEHPESHLRCDVTLAGQNTYRIVASLITLDGGIVASIEHYGSGHLDTLKTEALERLAAQLQHVAK